MIEITDLGIRSFQLTTGELTDNNQLSGRLVAK